jgi:hypothetical protein
MLVKEFTMKQRQLIQNSIKRQLGETCTEWFLFSVTAVIQSQEYFDLLESGIEKSHILCIGSTENKTARSGPKEATIPENIYNKSVLGNGSYTIFRDKFWEYIFINDEEDMNLLRLLLTDGSSVLVELSEINQKLKD